MAHRLCGSVSPTMEGKAESPVQCTRLDVSAGLQYTSEVSSRLSTREWRARVTRQQQSLPSPIASSLTEAVTTKCSPD